ncbi:hypothetical protein ACFL43_04665 [Thermodesulfobacteriota bacterium]
MPISFFKSRGSEKKLKKNLEHLRKEIERKPNDIRLRIKRAELYLEHNLQNQAIHEYLIAAKAYQAKRLSQIVLAIYKHIISIDPDRSDAYQILAELYLRDGYIGDAVSVLLTLAERYYRNDRQHDVTKILKRIIDLDPKNKMVRAKVARFYDNKQLPADENLKLGTFDRMKQRMKPRQDKPSSFDLQSALADDLKVTFAAAAIKEQLADQPSIDGLHPDTVYNKLKALMDEHPTEDTPDFHYNLGTAYLRCRQYEEAVDELLSALYGFDDKAECYMRLAECSLALNRYDAAEGFIGEGLRLASLTDKQKQDLSYQLGLIYKAEGDTKRAMEIFKKVYEADKSFIAALKEMQNVSDKNE